MRGGGWEGVAVIVFFGDVFVFFCCGCVLLLGEFFGLVSVLYWFFGLGNPPCWSRWRWSR